jgi:RNA polymerase-binding transcription factor DksA
MRKCYVCGEEINPKRLEILPNTQTCTQHSTVEKKVAVVTQMGEGDHTWTEVFVVEREEYDRMEELKNNFHKNVNSASETGMVDFDKEDEDEEKIEDAKNNLNLDEFDIEE